MIKGVLLVGICLALLSAGIRDYKSAKINNWESGLIFLLVLLSAHLDHRIPQALKLMTLVLVLFLIANWLLKKTNKGFIGGGDIKLYVGLSGLFSPIGVYLFMTTTFVVGFIWQQFQAKKAPLKMGIIIMAAFYLFLWLRLETLFPKEIGKVIF